MYPHGDVKPASQRPSQRARVIALCPGAIATLLWRPDEASWTLTTILKLTFSLVHGSESPLAVVQQPIDGEFLMDLVPFKPVADILVTGHAYAPPHTPTSQLVARVNVDDWSKSVVVTGDSVWIRGERGFSISAPRAFVRMPLIHERATKTPLNQVGFNLHAEPVEGQLAAPNLTSLPDTHSSEGSPSLGPVAPNSPMRELRRRGAPVDWVNDIAQIAPADFDFACFNAANADAQVPMIRPGPSVVLENLNPQRSVIATRLLPVRPKLFLYDGPSERATEVALRCDTLKIDTDQAIATLTYRGLAALDSAERASTVTLLATTNSVGGELRPFHVEQLIRLGGALTSERLEALVSGHDPLAKRHNGSRRRAPDNHDDAATLTYEKASIQGARVAAPKGLGLADYARITAWMDRGDGDRVRAAYAIEKRALEALLHAWQKRLAADADLARAFALALEFARRT